MEKARPPLLLSSQRALLLSRNSLRVMQDKNLVAEIKARKNKESQSDKQLTGKKSQTNTDSLWSDWDKNQLFSLISHFLHHREDRTCDVPDKGLGTLGMNTYSKCHFSAHLFSYSNQVFLASPPRDYCVMRSYVYTHCGLLNLSVGQEFYTA